MKEIYAINTRKRSLWKQQEQILNYVWTESRIWGNINGN